MRFNCHDDRDPAIVYERLELIDSVDNALRRPELVVAHNRFCADGSLATIAVGMACVRHETGHILRPLVVERREYDDGQSFRMVDLHWDFMGNEKKRFGMVLWDDPEAQPMEVYAPDATTEQQEVLAMQLRSLHVSRKYVDAMQEHPEWGRTYLSLPDDLE